jgi:hypothetical protein
VLFVAILFYFSCVESGLNLVCFFTLSDATLMYGTIPYGMVLHTVNLVGTNGRDSSNQGYVIDTGYVRGKKNESEDNHTNVV